MISSSLWNIRWHWFWPVVALATAMMVQAAAEARGFGRGSIRSINRAGGNSATWSGPRASGSTAWRRSGNTAIRSTTATTRRGTTLSGNRNATRSGNTLNVNRNLQSSTGASKSTTRSYSFDDGRLDSVSRQTTATDRFGRSASYAGRAEREGYGWEFEGSGRNRWGQKVEVEGYGARGWYGSGIVADVDGGRYGDRTVVAGKPYGGRPWVASLPPGYKPYAYWGVPYYSYAGVYYRPYYWHGSVHYHYVFPPWGAYYDDPPIGAVVVTTADPALWYAHGSYYQTTYVQGTTRYEVVPAPAGTTVPPTALPEEALTITLSGETFYFHGNTFYRRTTVNGEDSYVVVERPQGLSILDTLPAEFEPVEQGKVTLFKAGERYFVTYLETGGEERYLQVDPPVRPPQAESASAEAPSTAIKTVSVPKGTKVKVRLQAELKVSAVWPGDRFRAHLTDDLVVGQRLLAPRGARVYGRVVSPDGIITSTEEGTLAFELTDIEIGQRVLPLQTRPVSRDDIPAADRSARVWRTSESAGRLMEFELTKPLSVELLI